MREPPTAAAAFLLAVAPLAIDLAAREMAADAVERHQPPPNSSDRKFLPRPASSDRQICAERAARLELGEYWLGFWEAKSKRWAAVLLIPGRSLIFPIAGLWPR